MPTSAVLFSGGLDSAVLLAREAKGLLIGERADPQVVETVRDIIGLLQD